MRPFAILSVLFALAGCASGPSYDEPLPRATYQKVNVSSYAGAASDPGAPVTARGTHYETGAVSSAAADWARWPAGTRFRVLATGEIFEVDDFTEDIVGRNSILLYKPATPSSATREVTIEILQWGSPRESAELLRSQRSSTAKKILAELLARYPDPR